MIRGIFKKRQKRSWDASALPLCDGAWFLTWIHAAKNFGTIPYMLVSAKIHVPITNTSSDGVDFEESGEKWRGGDAAKVNT